MQNVPSAAVAAGPAAAGTRPTCSVLGSTPCRSAVTILITPATPANAWRMARRCAAPFGADSPWSERRPRQPTAENPCGPDFYLVFVRTGHGGHYSGRGCTVGPASQSISNAMSRDNATIPRRAPARRGGAIAPTRWDLGEIRRARDRPRGGRRGQRNRRRRPPSRRLGDRSRPAPPARRPARPTRSDDDGRHRWAAPPRSPRPAADASRSRCRSSGRSPPRSAIVPDHRRRAATSR